MITFKCNCGQMLKVPDEYAGKQGKCPKCSTVNIIPQPAMFVSDTGKTANSL